MNQNPLEAFTKLKLKTKLKTKTKKNATEKMVKDSRQHFLV